MITVSESELTRRAVATSIVAAIALVLLVIGLQASLVLTGTGGLLLMRSARPVVRAVVELRHATVQPRRARRLTTSEPAMTWSRTWPRLPAPAMSPPVGRGLVPILEYGAEVRRLWVHRDIHAPPEVVWEWLTNTERWPAWGPSVRSAQVEGGRLESAARGVVTTVLGFDLPFEITEYEDRARWAWKVAGASATDHTVVPLGPDRCRAGIGVPWPVAPYLAVCRVALTRLDTAATRERDAA